jgi:ATP-binding cassette, subfamily G (WHITE), member 2
VAPNMDVANALLPTYVVTLLFFAGFLLRFDDMPPWWKWYSYINFLRYAWSAVMVNNFEDGDPALFPGACG